MLLFLLWFYIFIYFYIMDRMFYCSKLFNHAWYYIMLYCVLETCIISRVIVYHLDYIAFLMLHHAILYCIILCYCSCDQKTLCRKENNWLISSQQALRIYWRQNHSVGWQMADARRQDQLSSPSNLAEWDHCVWAIS